MKVEPAVWLAGGAGLVFLGAVIYVAGGFVRGSTERPVYNYEWALCEAAEQCVAVPAPCGEWEAVNKRFETEAEAYYAHLITVVEQQEMTCLSTRLSTRIRGAYCQGGICTIAR